MKKAKRIQLITAFVVLIAATVFLFVDSKFYEDYKKAQAAKEEQQKLEAEQAEKERVASLTVFMKYIEMNDKVSITLIGDSITAGVGSEGYYEVEEGRVVYQDAENTYYEAVDTCDSWANGLKQYFAAHYEHVEVVNNGISGASTKYAWNHKEGWIGHDLDVVIVQLGTNDRWACRTVDEFEEYYRNLLEYIDGESEMMIVVAPPPTLNDDSAGYNFSTYDVNQVVLRTAEENGYTVFSQYDAINEYSKENEVPLEALLQVDGSHPLDKGYQLMYANLYEFLGLDSYK